MSACTFFGHRDCPSSIKPKLREVLIDLIENHTVDMFYVGQQGAFDSMVRSVLKELVWHGKKNGPATVSRILRQSIAGKRKNAPSI